jgi:RNA polymerase sigma factor (sigma-70 family)
MNTRDELITKHYGLVELVVGNYLKTNPQHRHLRDDLISGGTIGLIKAVDSFIQEKLPKLTPYARLSIMYGMRDVIRTEQPIHVPIRRQRDPRPGRDETDLDAVPDPRIPELRDAEDTVLAICRNESDRVLWALMKASKTVTEIAAEMMLSPTTVLKRQRALARRLLRTRPQ